MRTGCNRWGRASSPALVALALLAASCSASRLVPIRAYDASVSAVPDGARLDGPDELVPDTAGESDAVADRPDAPPDPGPDAPVVESCPPPTLVGFAAKSPGTTGGGGGRTVTVRTYDELSAAASSTERLIVELPVFIQAPADASQVRVQSNKTIRGVAAGAGMTGSGFLLSSVSNVIIQNLVLSKSLPEDAVTINKSTYVWVDHCDLSSDGTTAYDGLVDIAHGTDWVTVSWTVFHDHRLASLVGHSANPSDPTEDPGHLTVTYHHNWFRNTQSFNPKVRFGTAHVFNNFYDYPEGNSLTGVVSQLGAQVLVERNWFEKLKIPASTRDNESQNDPSKEGSILMQENRLSGTADPVVTKIGTWTPSASDYSYTQALDEVAIVPALVAKCAGPVLK